MKSLILALILFLALPFAYAETQIFSGKVITDTDKVIDGSTFRFTYDENSKKVFVQTPAGGLIVENGECKPNSIFRVCINRANFSYKNITSYVYYYEVDTTIYRLTGSLSTGSKVTLASLLQGEPAELTITMTNPTDFDITSIALNYDLAPFYISEVKGCELNNRQIQWKGSLKPKYDKTCTAFITAENEGKYSLSGNLSYFNGFETEKKATDTLAITVLPKQLKVTQSIDNHTEIMKPFYFNISLKNIHSSEDIDVLSTITLPGHVSLIKDTPTFDKNVRVLKHGLILHPGSSINYSLYVEKLSGGKSPVNLMFDYTIKGIRDSIENSTFVDVIEASPAKYPEPEAQPKMGNKSNSTLSNLTSASNAPAVQIPDKNKTSVAKVESNRTAGQVATISEGQNPKSFNGKALLIGIVIFTAFLVVIFIIFRARKGKNKEKDELVEKLSEELKQ